MENGVRVVGKEDRSGGVVRVCERGRSKTRIVFEWGDSQGPEKNGRRSENCDGGTVGSDCLRAEGIMLAEWAVLKWGEWENGWTSIGGLFAGELSEKGSIMVGFCDGRGENGHKLFHGGWQRAADFAGGWK
jgi:hypothetical protein